MDELISQLADLIKVNDIMTKDVKFYEYLEDPIKFCEERDIDKLPLKNIKKYMFFNKETKNFSEKPILFEEIITPLMTIDKFLEITEINKEKDLFFVFDNNNLVGVIHYCDLINSLAYVYFYAIFNVFERKVRDILKENNFKNKDVLSWFESKNTKESNDKIKRYQEDQNHYNLPEFQHFQLRDLLSFMELKIIKINNLVIDKSIVSDIPDVRNSIMHNKDISSRQKDSNVEKEMLYEREDYDKFLKVYYWLLEAIK